MELVKDIYFMNTGLLSQNKNILDFQTIQNIKNN